MGEDSLWFPVSDILSIHKSHIWIPALLKPHKCIPGAQFFIFKWGVFPIITAFYLPVPYPPWHIVSAHSEPCPFGTLPGLETDFGITDVPEKLFGWKYESGTGRDTKWVMTSEVKVPNFSARSRLLDPNPPCGPPSIPGVQKTDESKSASTSDAIDDLQPLIKCEKQTPSSMVSKSAKLSPTTWCSAPPPSAPPMFERRFPKLERRRRLSSWTYLSCKWPPP